MKPYPDVYPERDADREPQSWACRSIFLDGLDDGLIDVVEPHLARATAPDALVHLRVLAARRRASRTTRRRSAGATKRP